MTYRDNTAYDFELFTSKKEIVEIPAPKSAQHAAAVRKGQAARRKAGHTLKQRFVSAAAVSAVLLLVIAQLHCQLQNSEVVDQINQTEKAIETLQSEHTRLQVELEGKVSFTNMEKMAQETGMQKITVAQMQYVNLWNEDASEVVAEQSGLLAQFKELF